MNHWNVEEYNWTYLLFLCFVLLVGLFVCFSFHGARWNILSIWFTERNYSRLSRLLVFLFHINLLGIIRIMSLATTRVLLCVFACDISKDALQNSLPGLNTFQSQEVAICFPPVIIATACTAARQHDFSRKQLEHIQKPAEMHANTQ